MLVSNLLRQIMLTSLMIFTILNAFFAVAVDYNKVGVKQGQWIQYNTSVVYKGSGLPPEYIYKLTQVQWISITIVNVVDTKITITELTHFQNGTQESKTYDTDVKTGGMGFIIFAAGLKKGDPVQPNSSILINDTVSRRYLGTTRNANFVNFTMGGQTSYYFDQETGVILEFLGDYRDYKQEMKIGDTNIFAPTFLDWIIDNILIVALAGAIVILLVTVGILAFVSYRRQKIRAPPAKTNSNETPDT